MAEPKDPQRQPQLLTQSVLSFDEFWRWLQGHPNCILTAGTADTILCDHEQFHWHFAQDEDQRPLVQLIWGKNLIGELVLNPRDITYVQCERRGDEEFLFECVTVTNNDPSAAYLFTLSHDYNSNEPVKTGRFMH